MSGDAEPTVLVVDDNLDTARGLETELRGRVTAILSDPSDVESGDLARADLVLVDYTLDDWVGQDQASCLAHRPRNGLALAAVLRAHADEVAGARPVAFALYSGQIASIAGSLPPEVRDHALARLNNLEWVFEKGSAELADRIAELADAVMRLNAAGASEAAPDRLRRLLELPSADWADAGWRSVEACHPPLHELSEATHTLALLRWFAQRILPYPCFLWDSTYLAAAIGVTQGSLTRVLSTRNELRDALEVVRYTGVIANFLGARWWRAGVENAIWDITEGISDTEAALKSLSARAGFALEPLPHRAVVPLGSDYRPSGEPVAVENALRIQPDDWPPFADDAWTTVELARTDGRLRALVVEHDRSLLVDDE
jgi:hypothetical protein